MVDRRDLGSWLDGPGAGTRVEQNWPGERLGLPQSGSGSAGRFGRRLVAILVDWGLSLLIARWLIGDGSFGPLAVFLAEQLLLVGTLGATVGHVALGLRVVTLQGAPPGPLKAIVRSLLLVLAIPALVMDADGRGLHDRAAGTLVVRR